MDAITLRALVRQSPAPGGITMLVTGTPTSPPPATIIGSHELMVQGECHNATT